MLRTYRKHLEESDSAADFVCDHLVTRRWVVTNHCFPNLWGRSSARGSPWRHIFFDQLNWSSSWVLIPWLLISSSNYWWNVSVRDCFEPAKETIFLSFLLRL
jgi:hypothetical protein